MGILTRLFCYLVLFPLDSLAGTADPSGVTSLIFLAILLGYGLWVVVSIAVGIFVAKSAFFRILISGVIAAAPLTFYELKAQSYNNGLNDLKASSDQLLTSAESYLSEMCGKERILVSARPVASTEGVFIDANPDQKLRFLDAPPPSLETPEMRENQMRYGQSHPSYLHQLQYEHTLYVVREIFADSVLRESHFAFVENNHRTSKETEAVARKAWWTGPGRSKILLANTDEFERRLQNMPETDNYWLTQSVSSSTAKYVFTARDISTLDDRKHWVARVELTLKNKTAGEIVAQYIGFAANLIPGLSSHNHSAWELVKACPDSEQAYQKGRTWDAIGFFFREVVQYE